MSKEKANVPAPTDEPTPPVIRRSGTIALVGRPNVGKSTLLNAFLGEALAIVSATPQTTREKILGIVQFEDSQIGVLDTPGLHKPQSLLGKRMNSEARGAASEADVVVFVTDPGKPQGNKDMTVDPRDTTLLADIGKDKPTILVLNKIDLIQPKDKILPWIAAFSQVRDFHAVVPISAKKDDGLELVLREVAPLMPEREALFPVDELSDRPIRFFIAEYIREQVIKASQQEVPHSTAVTIDQMDESGRVPVIHATIHVERDGQKAIIIGSKGEGIRDIGIAARKRIEALMGRKVHLELFVRVTEGWTGNEAKLNELGYGRE